MSLRQSEFEEKLKEAKNNYLKTLNERYAILVSLKSLVFKAENINTEAFEEVYRCVHKLSGSSAMYGFLELGQTANKVELLLKEFKENGCRSYYDIAFQNFEILLSEIENILFLNNFFLNKSA